MPNWVLPALIAALATALVATSAAAIVQFRAADEARAERDALAAEVEELRAEVDELRDRLEDSDARAGGLLDDLLGGLGGDLGGLLDGLLGDGGDDEFGGLFDDLLGGGGLLGSSAPPGAACLTPDLAGGLDPGALLGGSSTPTDLDALVDQVSAQVAELRELEWQEDVEVAFLDDAATRQRLEELTALDDDARASLEAQEQLLIAMRAVDEDIDLEAVQQQLLGDAVAGFYVSTTGETVVRVPEEGVPGPADRITLAHELDHALTDQVLGLPDRTAPPLDGDRDAATAALAVIEGDATLLMSQWAIAHLSLFDQLQLATDPAIAGSTASLDGIPSVIVADLLFPYTAGLDWVCDRWLDGGWTVIDAAYADPPTTTAEILFGTPVEPTTPVSLDGPGAGFGQLERTTFGAAELSFHLDAPGGDPARALDDVLERTAAWGGGESTVWSDGNSTAAGLTLIDSGASPVSLCTTMTDWAERAFADARRVERSTGVGFDGARSAAVSCSGDAVLVGLAEDLGVATRVVGD
jgi:hypothetical protein